MRHGLADRERIADREHQVADLQRIGIGEFERREALAVGLDPQHRKIGAGVLEDDLGLELAPVGERDPHLVGAVDHVMVGDDETGRVDQHAGAERALLLLVRPGIPGAPKKRRKKGSSNSGFRVVTVRAA